MLIGYRYERTPEGDLHIHSHNGVMNIVAPLMGAIAFAAPVAFVAIAVAVSYTHLTLPTIYSV